MHDLLEWGCEHYMEDDPLEDLTKHELIRRVRQLNLLVLSVTNRAMNLTERLNMAETRQRAECIETISVLSNNIVVLRGLLRSNQQYIAVCETEIAELKALAQAKSAVPKVISYVGFQS